MKESLALVLSACCTGNGAWELLSLLWACAGIEGGLAAAAAGGCLDPCRMADVPTEPGSRLLLDEKETGRVASFEALSASSLLRCSRNRRAAWIDSGSRLMLAGEVTVRVASFEALSACSLWRRTCRAVLIDNGSAAMGATD